MQAPASATRPGDQGGPATGRFFWLFADLRGWPDSARAMTRLVILREVAGSTLANDAAAGVDSATVRAMTWLDGRLHDDAVASPPIGEEPFLGRFF